MAIAIHNIPEGICVAMPIYYATNKWKGFWWSFLSASSEPIEHRRLRVLNSQTCPPRRSDLLASSLA